ncbi:MAG: GspH/FimT family pseudopilin, partial [Thermomonas sp.]
PFGNRAMRRNRGFTLIETVIAMSAVGILAGIALPAFTDAGEAARNGAAKGALLEAWLGGVSHAAATGSEVVLCPGDATGCRGGIDWTGGWIVFADLDGNRTRSPNETLLKTADPLTGKVHLRSTVGRTKIVFQPNGGNAGSNVTFTLCDGRGAGKASTIVLSNSGGLRAGTPTAAAAQACMLAI